MWKNMSRKNISAGSRWGFVFQSTLLPAAAMRRWKGQCRYIEIHPFAVLPWEHSPNFHLSPDFPNPIYFIYSLTDPSAKHLSHACAHFASWAPFAESLCRGAHQAPLLLLDFEPIFMSFDSSLFLFWKRSEHPLYQLMGSTFPTHHFTTLLAYLLKSVISFWSWKIQTYSTVPYT